MNSEFVSEQRNNALETLKQRQKTASVPPALTEQQPNVLYTMPMQTVERLENVLRGTLALQESIRASMDSLATKESLEPLATTDLLARWLNQTEALNQETYQSMAEVLSGMKAQRQQDGKQQGEFTRQLSQLDRQFRGDGAELMRTFRRWAVRTILSSAAAALAVSVLICKLLS